MVMLRNSQRQGFQTFLHTLKPVVGELPRISGKADLQSPQASAAAAVALRGPS